MYTIEGVKKKDIYFGLVKNIIKTKKVTVLKNHI